MDLDQETARKYLLGQLTDGQQEEFEERLLSEDELAEELQVTKTEIVDDYLTKRLTAKETEWLEQTFLSSPEGKQSLRFGATFQRYLSTNVAQSKKQSWIEKLTAFWHMQSTPLRAAAAVALVVIVVGIVWLARTPSPQSFATLTLANSITTRSDGFKPTPIKLNSDALRLTLLLPSSDEKPNNYRVDVTSAEGKTKSAEIVSKGDKSITVVIPAAELARGQYAATGQAQGSDGVMRRIPGGYYFTVE